MRPDLVVCMGFPWKIPADALAVLPLGCADGPLWLVKTEPVSQPAPEPARR